KSEGTRCYSRLTTESQNVHADGVCNGMMIPQQKAQPCHSSPGSDPLLESDKTQFTIALPATIETPHCRLVLMSARKSSINSILLCDRPHTEQFPFHFNLLKQRNSRAGRYLCRCIPGTWTASDATSVECLNGCSCASSPSMSSWPFSLSRARNIWSRRGLRTYNMRPFPPTLGTKP